MVKEAAKSWRMSRRAASGLSSSEDVSISSLYQWKVPLVVPSIKDRTSPEIKGRLKIL